MGLIISELKIFRNVSVLLDTTTPTISYFFIGGIAVAGSRRLRGL